VAQGAAQEPGHGPRTYVGRWLWATMRKDRELADRFGSLLNDGQPGWNLDEPSVVQAAAELIARRLFRADYDVREVTAIVADMRARLQKVSTPPGQLEMEAVVRAALGETDVALDGIRPSVRLRIQLAIIGKALYELALGESDIDQLVADAERIAFERGWSPSLAD